MKLCIPFVLFLVAVVASPSMAQVTATVSVPDDILGVLGEIATAPVQIDDATGLQAFDLVIDYDTALLDLTEAGIRAGSLGPFTLTANLQENLGHLIIGGRLSDGPLTGGSGSLLELDFEVTAAPGESPVALSRNPTTGGVLNEGGIAATLDSGSIVTVVPEPSTLAAFLVGLLLVAPRRRFR